MTPREMRALVPGPGWGDGRVGYCWCRFDAFLRVENGLRAEVTWAPSHEDGPPVIAEYHTPELKLETNRRVRDEWQTLHYTIISVTAEEAVRIVTSPAANLLADYQHEWAALIEKGQ